MNKKTSYSIHTSNDITNIGTVEIEFAIFCIENVAEKLKMPGVDAYDLIAKKTDILYGYIIPNYEVLHTQGKEYIVNDLIGYMKECGVIE